MGNKDDTPTTSALPELTEALASDWRNVGRILTTLEKTGRIAADGEQWINKVKEKLDAIGHPMSTGHLHKVRRAYDFLSSSIRMLGIPEENSRIAKVSSIEIAERLYQIDAKAGSEALEACLNLAKPATAAEIKKIYDSYLEKHPAKKSAMHAAWEQRKKASPSKQQTNESSIDDGMSSLSSAVSQVQTAARQKDETIKELQDELGETKRLLAEVEHELSIVVDQVKDARLEILSLKRQ
jgi:hypothetical protein